MVISDTNRTHPSCGRCKAPLFEQFAVVMGYVYVLSNPAMLGLLKIGQTRASLKQRVKQLSGATGVPKPFRVEAAYLSEDPEADERALHRALIKSRAPGREFFEVTLEDVVRAGELTLKATLSFCDLATEHAANPRSFQLAG